MSLKTVEVDIARSSHVNRDTRTQQEQQENYKPIENKASKPKKSHTLKRVMILFGPYKLRVFLVILATLLANILTLTIPVIIPFVVDDAIPKRNFPELVSCAVIMISASILSGIVGVGQTYLSNIVGQKVMRDLRNALYSHLQNLSLRFFTSMHTGEIQSRLSNDITSAQVAVTDTFTSLITNFVVIVGTVSVMFYLNPVLTLVLFVCLPLFLIPALNVGKVQRKAVKATQQSLGALTSLMQETLSVSGILLIKTFGRKKSALDQFEEKNEELMQLSIYQQMLGRWFMMFMNTFMTLVPVILYVIGGYLIIFAPGNQHISLGVLVAFVTIQGRFFGPVNQFSLALIGTQSSLALFDRIFEYLDQEVEIEDAPNAVELPASQVRGEVIFKDVSFSYQKYDMDLPTDSKKSTDSQASDGQVKDVVLANTVSHMTIHNLSFQVKPGQLVALVGSSGSGKTTMTYLLSRLYEVDNGMIKIDGHDIRQIALSSLQNLIGMVTQETYLFHATVRENLLYVRPEATDAEIVAAAKAAAIHERILALDHGYETTVGERGYKLSGGEKQRIAIARVLLKDPRILILDEATSALDTTSERLIQHALEPLMRGRTTIAIAHRLSTILAADLILVMDKGKIVERGNHRELLEYGGMYSKLYNQQFASNNRSMPVTPRVARHSHLSRLHIKIEKL